ncbi:hypothetical protein [Glycomyces sp. NPDC021274]|uniref:hypothetical protein n=1 Tax=Glycomyces sp. NPDC021274 TaxID=3155120 RepID=UPI0033E34949
MTTAEATEPEPSPTPEQPTAADGTDYAACGDGSCEVAVSEPVDLELDGFTLQVTAVIEDGVDISTERGGGSTSAGISGGYCVAFLTENGVQTGCYGGFVGDERPPVPEAEPGVLIVELLDFTAGTAILRITSL